MRSVHTPDEDAARNPASLELAPPLREVWSVKALPSPAPCLAAEDLVFIRDDRGQLAALDAESGRHIWSYPFLASLDLVHNGFLYVWSSGEMHLIDPRTGRPEACLPCPFHDAALATGRFLIIRRPSWADFGPALLCLDSAGGQRLWRRALREGSVSEGRGLAASEELALVGTVDGELLALDLQSGAERWRRSWPEWGHGSGERFEPPTVGPLFVSGPRVLARVGSMHVVSLSLDDGRTAWQQEGDAQYVYGDHFYTTTMTEYFVHRLSDGKQVRKARFAGRPPRPLAARPPQARGVALVSESHAFVLSGEGLVAVERDTGVYAWHHPIPGSIGGPVAFSGRLYYKNGDRLFCLVPER